MSIKNTGTRLSGIQNEDLLRKLKLVFILLAGQAALLLLFWTSQSSSGKTSFLISGQQKSSTTRDADKNWNAWTTRATEWEIRNGAQQEQEEDQNWAGRQKMRTERANGALWWDEKAEQYFISKLEATQFPANCSQVHWIAHYDHLAGLLSTVHIFLLPLFFSMLRGQTLVVTAGSRKDHPFDGCGPNVADHNMRCFFNFTNCNPGDDPLRMSQILAMQQDEKRTRWEQLLMEEDNFFPQDGVTVIQTYKPLPWDTNVCVGTSSFTSFADAYNYYKFSLWNTMGRYGNTGVVQGDRTKEAICFPKEKDCLTSGRADMVMTSLMSSWMLRQMDENVRLVADQIMSRYMDQSGKPLWQPPVLGIHVRRTDKGTEDPYYLKHGTFRPIEDYVLHMSQMEEKYGFQWPSVFIISDSGTARDTLVGLINSTTSTGNLTATGQDRKYIMYDWIEDEHLIEKSGGHSNVPSHLKHEMQVHFLATMYIVEKIVDHSIVTYSSNVGRFIGEIMAAKNKLAFVEKEGPLVTSLDNRWAWLEYPVNSGSTCT